MSLWAMAAYKVWAMAAHICLYGAMVACQMWALVAYKDNVGYSSLQSVGYYRPQMQALPIDEYAVNIEIAALSARDGCCFNCCMNNLCIDSVFYHMGCCSPRGETDSVHIYMYRIFTLSQIHNSSKRIKKYIL